MGQVEPLESGRVVVDDDEGQAFLREGLAHETSHAAVAADDDVVLELREAPLHPLSPQESRHLAAHDGPKEFGGRVEEREDAAERQRHREDATRGARAGGFP